MDLKIPEKPNMFVLESRIYPPNYTYQQKRQLIDEPIQQGKAYMQLTPERHADPSG